MGGVEFNTAGVVVEVVLVVVVINYLFGITDPGPKPKPLGADDKETQNNLYKQNDLENNHDKFKQMQNNHCDAKIQSTSQTRKWAKHPQKDTKLQFNAIWAWHHAKLPFKYAKQKKPHADADKTTVIATTLKDQLRRGKHLRWEVTS